MRTIAAGLVALALAAQSYPPPFPRPGATKVFENDRVRVWDVVWPKGQPTPMHRHVYDVTGVFYAPGVRKITMADGTVRQTTSEVGTFTWSPKGTTHTEDGASDPPTHGILMELKDTVPSGQIDTRTDVPPAFPRDGAKQVFDNAKIVVWDYTWTPGVEIPMHRHTRDAVVVWLADGKLRSTSPTDPPSIVEAKTGQVRYSARGTVHTENVIEGRPRAMVFEPK
jgi:predicted metal-dependent enzyme (double-stranded beta helix superfamily)